MYGSVSVVAILNTIHADKKSQMLPKFDLLVQCYFHLRPYNYLVLKNSFCF
jgi:hypothetical protein